MSPLVYDFDAPLPSRRWLPYPRALIWHLLVGGVLQPLVVGVVILVLCPLCAAVVTASNSRLVTQFIIISAMWLLNWSVVSDCMDIRLRMENYTNCIVCSSSELSWDFVGATTHVSLLAVFVCFFILFNLAGPMRGCFGNSSLFLIAILNGTFFRGTKWSLGRRVTSKKLTIIIIVGVTLVIVNIASYVLLWWDCRWVWRPVVLVRLSAILHVTFWTFILRHLKYSGNYTTICLPLQWVRAVLLTSIGPTDAPLLYPVECVLSPTDAPLLCLVECVLWPTDAPPLFQWGAYGTGCGARGTG